MGAITKNAIRVYSQKLEHGCRMIHAGRPSFFGLGLEDGPVPTFWLLLQSLGKGSQGNH